MPYTRDSRAGRVPARFPANGGRFGGNGSVGTPDARFGVPQCRRAEGVVGGPRYFGAKGSANVGPRLAGIPSGTQSIWPGSPAGGLSLLGNKHVSPLSLRLL